MADATSTLTITVDRNRLTADLSRRVAIRDTIPFSITCDQGTFPSGPSYQLTLVVGNTAIPATATNGDGTLTGTLDTNVEELLDLWKDPPHRESSTGQPPPIEGVLVLTDSTPRTWASIPVRLYFCPDVVGAPAGTSTTVYLTQTLADGLYEPRAAAIQSHITGTGSPHTAAGVGAEAAGAVSSHAGLVDGTAHADSGVADPAVVPLTVTGGAVSVAVTTAARRFDCDLGAAEEIEITEVTGLEAGGEPVMVRFKTTGDGIVFTWPGTPLESGDPPEAAGYHRVLIWLEEDEGDLYIQYLETPT